jgi:hypothetical protein
MYNWFQANGGTEKSSLEQRLITDDLKRQHLIWVEKYWLMLTDPEAAVGMLDEKWFYIFQEVMAKIRGVAILKRPKM